MTSSLCNCANSGVLTRTFFRRRKSCVGSPTGVPGPRESLATEGALESEVALEMDKAGRGVWATPEAEGVPGTTGVPGGRFGVPDILGEDLLTAMIVVSSVLNFSRSLSATA